MNLTYTAIVLDDPSAVKEMFPCEYPDKYYHHVTLRFRPISKPRFNGQKVKVSVIATHKDEMAYAASVKIHDNEIAKYCENKFPHITLATESRVKPVYSNLLIKNTEANKLENEIILEGTVGSFINGHWDFTKC